MTTPLVVLPVSPADYHLALKWVRWVKAMGCNSVPLCVLVAKSVPIAHIAALRYECSIMWSVVQLWEDCERPDIGYAYAANVMFRSALEYAEDGAVCSPRPLLWCEADTVPTRPTWYDEICAEYAACGKPFMGAFHPHGKIPHMTGNAVYAANWRELAPSLAALPGPNPGQGWDSACAHETVPQMHIAKTIQQEWVTPPFSEASIDRYLKPAAALFHRTKDGTMIDVLARRMGIDPIPLTAPIAPPTSPMIPESVTAIPRQMRTEILIVTYAKDMEFLRYCLKSIQAYASGFYGITLVVPDHEVGLYDWVRKQARIKYFKEVPGKGMMSAQVQKLRADEWCPQADVIVTLDADCMFFRRVTPGDYVKDGRCRMVREHYSVITNPNRHIWKRVVKDAIGWEPEYDTMVMHPQVHHRSVYKLTRDAVERYTGRSFDEYVTGCKNDFPQGFCEWVTVGAVAHRYMEDDYDMIDYPKAEDAAMCLQQPGSFQALYRRDRDFLVEWWSHGGIARYKSDCDAVLAGRIPAYFVK